MEHLAKLARLERAGGDPAQARLRVGDDRGEGLIDLASDGFASSSRLAAFNVTTKPCGPVVSPFEMLWLTMPITSPWRLNIGPPEFSVSMAASVWKNSARGMVW